MRILNGQQQDGLIQLKMHVCVCVCVCVHTHVCIHKQYNSICIKLIKLDQFYRHIGWSFCA